MKISNGWLTTIGTAMALLLATSVSGQAQQSGMMGGQMHRDTVPAAAPCPGGMGGMGMMQGRGMMGGGMGMMNMMGTSPSMLLSQRDVLELTEDQVAQLEELQQKQQGMMQGMHAGMMAVRSQMQDVMAADSLDMDAYRKAVEAMADQMVGHQMQMARFREQVLDVLPPEQREKVRTGMQMMRHMMGGGMRGPMR